MKWNHARVASNIRRLQKAKGWKHIRLAEVSGVNYQKLRSVLSASGIQAKERLYCDEFLALALALGVSAEELAFGHFTATVPRRHKGKARRFNKKGR